MSNLGDFGPAISSHQPSSMSGSQDYPNSVHTESPVLDMFAFQEMRSPTFAPASHMMPTIINQPYFPDSFSMPPRSTSPHNHTEPGNHGFGRDSVDQNMMYDHQTGQYLCDQQTMIQYHLDQQAATRLQMEQNLKYQAKITAVGLKLGDQVTEIENLPFAIPPVQQKSSSHGVVRISNLPYAVTRHEIHQLLGRHASVLGPEHGGGVHIIMERSTAKTMDAFVEFKTQKDAESAFRRLSYSESGRYARLGTRHVDISMSSQDELLENIFPRANCIQWRNGCPTLLENNDPFSVGFQGFLTKEEVRGLISHAENPARSPFTERCRQRTYECLISTLWKYPWHATTMYTVEDRDNLYQATLRQMLELCEKAKQRRFIGLNEALLRDLLRAGLSCPAFNERQKVCLIAASELTPLRPIMSYTPLEFWPFDCLVKQPTSDEWQVMYYAQLIRKGLEINGGKDLAVPNNWRNRFDLDEERPWGDLWIEWEFHNKSIIFETAAQLEMQVAMGLLQTACETLRTLLPSPMAPAYRGGSSCKESSDTLEATPSQTATKELYTNDDDSLSFPWAEDAAKSAAINVETPSRRPHRNSSISTLSDYGSSGNVTAGAHGSISTSTSFSGRFSRNNSSCSSFMTTDSDRNLDLLLSECSVIRHPKTNGSHHKHSFSMSSIATRSTPLSTKDNSNGISVRSRRGESIDIADLMERHNIWSGTTPPSSGPATGRTRYGSRHTSISSTSLHRRLPSVSEDEEDVVKKHSLKNISLTSA